MIMMSVSLLPLLIRVLLQLGNYAVVAAVAAVVVAVVVVVVAIVAVTVPCKNAWNTSWFPLLLFFAVVPVETVVNPMANLASLYGLLAWHLLPYIYRI